MRNVSKIFALILAGLMGGLSFPALAEIDLSQLPPAATQTGLTYTNDIMPLFKVSCFRCHGGQQHRAGLSLDSLDGVMKGTHDGPIVTVGDSTNSQLVIAISRLDPKSAMPPKPRRPRPPGGPGGPGGPGPGSPMGTNGLAGNPPPRPPGPPAKPLTPEQVGLVRAWIDQGAK